MDFLRRIRFNLWYLQRPPWDSGITPPELVEFVAANPPGRAIDLGCGTGTNAIYLAQHNWHVTGVDFALRAIEQARQKAAQANLKVDFKIDDVARLRDVIGPFDLVLDIGCYQSLGKQRQEIYRNNLKKILVPSGVWLLYFFRKQITSDYGLTEGQIEALSRELKLTRREDGRDTRGRASSWLWLQRA